MKGLTCWAAAVALAASYDALALGKLANVTLIDRESGTALSTHYFQGEYWVAGNPGGRYAIEVRNCIGGRLLAVASVDGVNVISGATAGWDQSGYVFDPGQSYEISGWRKSNAEVAAFVFTPSPNSYAARTGRPANVGVVGVALFRERQPQPVYTSPMLAPSTREAAAPAPGAASPSALDESTTTAAPSAGSLERAAADQARAPAASAKSPPAARLGTGHGEREYSYVQDTEFRRLHSEPDEIIRIRYDSFDHLVAMGIIRQPRPLPSQPNPFPGSQERQFVPDPPG
jgi:hypothetical protein